MKHFTAGIVAGAILVGLILVGLVAAPDLEINDGDGGLTDGGPAIVVPDVLNNRSPMLAR